jgi:hypothetical protein
MKDYGSMGSWHGVSSAPSCTVEHGNDYDSSSDEKLRARGGFLVCKTSEGQSTGGKRIHEPASQRKRSVYPRIWNISKSP